VADLPAMDDRIPFNRPHTTGRELDYLAEVLGSGALAGDGPFTQRCHDWMEQRIGAGRALLTHSCTGALEMAALLLDIEPGDEVVMPSFTFVSTANAFALRGAVPVFVDVREDTLNLDETLIEAAVTSRTRAIVPVHYAGVACEMDAISEVARRHDLKVVEDAAQGICASYKGQPLGGFGDFSAFSFHATKNVIAGEGGALMINDPSVFPRAEIVREKGTDRSRFHRGEVDKYTWQEIGSSYLPSELIAGFLWAQLQEAEAITAARLEIWHRYHDLLGPLEERGSVRRPIVPDGCEHNAHMYYLLLNEDLPASDVLTSLRNSGIGAVSHYVPLHSAPAGKRLGRTSGSLRVTERDAERIIRLPLWVGLTESQQERVVEAVADAASVLQAD
jgi:dTDP-4-amino-4,6-dideoxygalactose transaminase